MSRFSSTIIGLSALLFCGLSNAAENEADDLTTRKVNFVPTANAASHPPAALAKRKPGTAMATLVFSAPPRESAAEASRIYQPVAAFFSSVLGRAVEYKRPDNWMVYQKEMARGDYDIVIDGPHLNSWRINNLQHVPLAKIVDLHSFSVVVRRGDMHLTSLKQLAGKRVCAMNSPDLDTLALLAEFDPMRQPLVIDSESPARGYQGLMQARCDAATIPTALLPTLDTDGVRVTRTVYESRTMPSETFSAGPRVTSEDQIRLAQAIVSADGKRALTPLLSANGANSGLALADKNDYKGMDVYLKDVWGLRH